jgi:hypothetical protein
MATRTDQEWAVIPSSGGLYAASSRGAIRRLKRSPHHPQHNGILKPVGGTNGYLTVTINKRQRSIHRLIAEAFLGECPSTLQVNHKDGNKQNNNIENLEYVSCRQNLCHALSTGLRTNRGDKNAMAKLTEDTVREILSLKGTATQQEIGARFGVTRRAVGMIFNGDTWSHITGVRR